MGTQLTAWNTGGKHTAVVKRLHAQLDGVCAKLPERDAAREACLGVFGKGGRKV
jgi:hypothetical protein